MIRFLIVRILDCMSSFGWFVFYQMFYGEDGVAREHFRASVSHYVFYSVAHIGFVAVGEAFGAGRFGREVGTFGQAVFGVVEKFGAVGAESVFGGRVILATEDMGHNGEGF